MNTQYFQVMDLVELEGDYTVSEEGVLERSQNQHLELPDRNNNSPDET